MPFKHHPGKSEIKLIVWTNGRARFHGELSAARVSLEGAEVAPGTLTTLRELTNPERRPPIPRRELSQEIARSEPAVLFDFDVNLSFASKVRHEKQEDRSA